MILPILPLLYQPGQVVELRAINVASERGRPFTSAGYFDDWQKLTASAMEITKRATGVYVVLNPINPSLLARSANKLKNYLQTTTSDTDILSRQWLPADLDPVRPAGIGATEAEHQAAISRAGQVWAWLTARGWPDPIRGDSGNGGHLLYRVELAVDDKGLIKRCLQALSLIWDDADITIDKGNFNPSRIWKLYGTTARKGDSTPDRPHRVSGIIEAPKQVQIVSRELLEALAAEIPPDPPRRSTGPSPSKFDLDRFISTHLPGTPEPRPWNGTGRRWVLSVCPWSPDHTDRSAYICEHPSGAISAGCHHNSCQGRKWSDLRTMLEPPRQGYTGPQAVPSIQEDIPPPTDADSPILDSVTETTMPAGLLSTPLTARWLGHQAATGEHAPDIRRLLPSIPEILAAYDEGVALFHKGTKIGRPADEVSDTDAQRVKRLVAKPNQVKKPDFTFPVTIEHMLRRSVLSRATYDMTLACDGRAATLVRLSGAILGSYRAIRDLALELQLPLPSVERRAANAWDDLVAHAIISAENAPIETEENTILAIRQEIAGFVLYREIGEEEMDLRRGLVLQDEKGIYVYILPKILVSHIRARLQEDRPTREQIVDAATMLGMTSMRPLLDKNQRPRVWAFLIDELKKEKGTSD